MSKWIKAEEIEPESDFGKIFKEIDWKPLEDEVSNRIGIPITFTTKELQGERVKVSTDNLIDDTGIFYAVFSEVKIEDSGAQIVPEKKIMWTPMHFSWRHREGGTNGASLLRASYSFETKEWEFSKGV